MLTMHTRLGPLVVGFRPTVPLKFAAALNEAIELVLRAMSDKPSRQTVYDLARDLRDAAERRLAAAWERAAGEGLTGSACQAGCSFCCRQLRVEVTAPEVFAIAQHLHNGAAGLTADEALARCLARAPGSRVCPLLVDDRCSIYPVREVVARGYHSLERSACEREFARGTEAPVLPLCIEAAEVTRALFTGCQAALTTMGLASEGYRLELHSALTYVLQTPDALDRWLEGEPVFASVEVPVLRD